MPKTEFMRRILYIKSYIAVGPSSVPTPLFSKGLQQREPLLQRGLFSKMSSKMFAFQTYQMLKLCRQAAIVRFLHVHDFCVGTEDVKLPWPKIKMFARHIVRLSSPQRLKKNTFSFEMLCLKAYPRMAATSPDSLKNENSWNTWGRFYF